MNSRRRLSAAILTVTMVTGLVSLTSTADAEPAGAGRPVLSLKAAADTVTVARYGKRAYLDLGIYAVAGDEPFEIRAVRPSYARAIEAWRVTAAGNEPLPEGIVSDFSGFDDFFHLRLTDRSGKAVLRKTTNFCPNRESVRTRPDAPDRSPYPEGCPRNPFTLGSVWGVQEGWGVPVFGWRAPRARLANGRYTARLSIDMAYRRAFDIPRDAATTTVTVKVVEDDGCHDFGCGHDRRGPSTAAGAPTPASSAPSVTGAPSDGHMPDLRSLPAFRINVHRGRYLAFSANVWNAGPSPLVVDGFRRDDEDVMDAYQYFYDANGDVVGSAPTGAMEWDARDGHSHWHFRDFARYRLVDADKEAVVRSSKEAFCLANTDAVDYTVPGANWRPYNTDLRTACGSYGSLAVREVLDAGSGDTYGQWLPGQSFRLRGLPNGTYFIEVEANPMHRLYESSTDNNVSYRKVILGGKPDARTVRVPAVGLIRAR